MANLFYNSAKAKLLNGGIDLDTDTIKVALIGPTYTPSIDADDFFDDVSPFEVSGTGYTAGGQTLTSVVVTQDNTNDRAYFDAADSSWPSSTITNARYAVLYKSTGTPSTSALIGYVDFGANKSTAGDTFYIQWADPTTGGILYLA